MAMRIYYTYNNQTYTALFVIQGSTGAGDRCINVPVFTDVVLSNNFNILCQCQVGKSLSLDINAFLSKWESKINDIAQWRYYQKNNKDKRNLQHYYFKSGINYLWR